MTVTSSDVDGSGAGLTAHGVERLHEEFVDRAVASGGTRAEQLRVRFTTDEEVGDQGS